MFALTEIKMALGLKWGFKNFSSKVSGDNFKDYADDLITRRPPSIFHIVEFSASTPNIPEGALNSLSYLQLHFNLPPQQVLWFFALKEPFMVLGQTLGQMVSLSGKAGKLEPLSIHSAPEETC